MLLKRISMILAVFAMTFSFVMPIGANASGEPISVKLQNYIGSVSSLSFTTVGSYQVDGTDLFITPDTTYTFKVESGNLSLYKEGSLVKKFGASVTVMPSIRESMDSIMKIDGKTDRKYLGEVEFTVESGKYVRPINHITLEDYLKGVVPAEMPASWGNNGGEDALKAQSVAARTFVLKKNSWSIYDGQSDQVYKGYDWHPNTTLAVNETQGDVLKSGENYASAFYSSTNGGRVFSNKNIWGTTLVPYFQTKEDPYDSKRKEYKNWTFSLEKRQIELQGLDLKKPEAWWNEKNEENKEIVSTMKSWLKSKKHIGEKSEIKIIDITDVQLDIPTGAISSNDVLNGKVTFTYIEKNDGNFVKEDDGNIKVLSKTIQETNYNIRYMLGTSTMKSPYIQKVDKSDSQYVIQGSGFGHGIGMSQYGAFQMATEGHNFKQILDFYYPNTKVEKEINPAHYNKNIEGDDRYATSAEVSKFGWQNKSKALVIGRGDVSIDALTGSVLAKKYDSPLLLTRPGDLPETVFNEINRLKPEKVYLLGGESAINTSIQRKIDNLSFVKETIRISGAERYQTAVEVAKEIKNNNEIFVVTKDEKSPDSLSIASYASMLQIPILYTTKDELHESVRNYINENNISKVTIIGGTAVVSSKVENELKNLANSVTRVSGSDRYDTSLKIAERYKMDFEEKTLFFARGDEFIDALPASALAAAMKSPLILTQQDAVPKNVKTWLDGRTVLPDAYFLGGNGAISYPVRDEIKRLLMY
ncbi:SpoIID/LytB domain-containing protein [Rossellomorea aquimaris]|uniref:SpoIID/LytB domain-containing protein n=1 Tax=Rossellomorea aquimaris TaxID=189382 RepID=UPI001CD79FFD|nr:SpoIID/LytB domain-containing protein [Rossellomorea aquimaris]MCA1060796.1 SpoIID/LytB domain-containing protein [Rossellomorea aquimaris]